jgi:ABC-type nitrate/sulfonate/bicarbonate transport system substrate-binding protein
MFGPTLLNDNPDAGKKFMIAYVKAAQQYAEGKTERNLEIAEKYMGMDRETLLNSPWTPQNSDGRIDVEDVLTFQDWAYDSGYIDSKMTEEQLIDASFVDYANQMLGQVNN